ncbi:MAG: MarR family winged helix-turn-helix transcriptional regulator [Gemmatimonadota bacterium]
MAARPSLLQRELKQQKPFTPTDEALLALMRTSDLIRRKIGVVVEREGITLQQYNVLRILRGAGASGCPTLDIGDRMIEHAPGITRLVDRLERAGLAQRRRCTEDRRQVFCEITPAGLALLERLEGPMLEAKRAAVRGLSLAEQKQLITLLERLRSVED